MPPPEPSHNRLRVVADALNVRRTPSLRGSIIGLLRRNDIVEGLESENAAWQKVQKGDMIGWSSRRHLVPFEPRAPSGRFDEISKIASTSAIAHYKWKDRGVAPLGYTNGMALVFASVYCKLKAGDPAAMEISKADTGNRNVDALAWYAQEFRRAGMDNEGSGVSTLRHVFVLLFGLGMRESSGRYCEGRDRSARNTTAASAEAGLFQTSYNATRAHPRLQQIFEQYLANPSDFVDVFKKGVRCTASDLENFGSGRGKEFQRLSKECPAFATEFAALGLRVIRAHWGPITRREVEIRPECNTMLLEVQHAVDTLDLCPELI
ncbi:MAG TPA: SH3 domain-containing protein [Terrimicrobiaceae bacterium]